MRGFEDSDERQQETNQAAYRQSDRPDSKNKQKRMTYGRRGIGPTTFNGIHRRRKKRIMW